MKKNNLPSYILIILFLFQAGLFAQSFNKEEKEIFQLQDTRTLGAHKKLLTYLHSEDNNLISKCLRALANIADTNTVDSIEAFMLANKDESLQSLIAFTLGQIPCEKSRTILLNSVLKQTGGFLYSIEALGKVGNENDLNQICSYTSVDSAFNEHIAIAISNFANRKIRNENSVSSIKRIIEVTFSRNIYNLELMNDCSYALNRIADKNLLNPAQNELMVLTTSRDPETRMWAFSSLGKLQDNSYTNYFLDNYFNENDWRVRVNLLIAVGNLPNNETAFQKEKVADKLLEIGGKDFSKNAAITAFTVLGKLFTGNDLPLSLSAKIKHTLKGYLFPTETIDWQIRSAAVQTLAKIFKDSVKNDLFSAYTLADNYDLKADIIRAFGNLDNGLVYKEIRDSISADVQRYNAKNPDVKGDLIGSPDLAKIYKAFVDVLADLDHKVPDEEVNTFRLIFTEFMGSKNPAITDVSITNLQDSLFIKYRPETEQILLFDYNELTPKNDIDVMQELIQAMGTMKVQKSSDVLTKNLTSNNYDIAKASADALHSISDSNYESKITAKRYRTDFDWDYIDYSGEKKYATIQTNVGDIKISLIPQYAPFTVENFLKLSENKFYDGTIFHRVVPNFVIQGGDRTGTGYGSPGYSIRSEISELGFLSYYAGMASSGKDTEGSQFFITHSPQHHLDGKYTVFGLVVSGQDVVDRIQIGDYIVGISISGY